jgi:hypothetical protein
METKEQLIKNKNIIIPALRDWALTFDGELDEEGEKTDKTYNYITYLANNLEKEQLTEQDVKEIYFHIWQIEQGDIKLNLI